MSADERLPLYVLTGFLGSGKTSLLRTLLRHPDFVDTAVIVNEFGEAGLDHHLLESADEETVVLQGGCVCCTVREDLAATIGRLIERRAAGTLPPFRRLIIETSGLADPVPIVHTLKADPRVATALVYRGTLVTVDAQHALPTLARHPEALRQLALADRVVVTKVDLAAPDEVAATDALVARINPGVATLHSTAAGLTPDALLADLEHDPGPSLPQAMRWLREPLRHGAPADAGPDAAAPGFQSFSWLRFEAIDWTVFGIWLTMLLHAHGTRILRVKGLLHVAGAAGPVAIHGVQHVVHPPVHLEHWGEDARLSRLVFIVSGIPEARIRRSLDAFMRLAEPGRAGVARSKPVGAGAMIGGRPIKRPGAPAWLKG